MGPADVSDSVGNTQATQYQSPRSLKAVDPQPANRHLRPHALHSTTMPCYNFFHGTCSHGDQCFFSHEAQHPSSPSFPSPTYSNFPYAYMPPAAGYQLSLDLMAHHPQAPQISRPPSSQSTSPSTRSYSLSTADSDDAAGRAPSDSSRPTRTRSSTNSRSSSKTSTKKRRKPQRHRYGEGSAEMFTFWQQSLQNPYAPIPNPMYFPSDAVKNAHERLKAVEARPASATHPITDIEKYIIRTSADTESTTPSHEEPSIPPPVTHFIPSVPSYPPEFDVSVYALPPTEIIDFDLPEDESGEPAALAIDATVDVEVYQGRRVGVLGGGVMLGSAQQPSRSGIEVTGHEQCSPATVIEEMTTRNSFEIEDDEVSATVETVEPCPITLTPSNDKDVEMQDADIHAPSPVATTAESPCLRAASFSWADAAEDDDEFLNEPLTDFSPSSEKPNYPVENPTPLPSVGPPAPPVNAWFRPTRPASLTLPKSLDLARSKAAPRSAHPVGRSPTIRPARSSETIPRLTETKRSPPTVSSAFPPSDRLRNSPQQRQTRL